MTLPASAFFSQKETAPSAPAPLLHIDNVSIGFSLGRHASPLLAAEQITLALPQGKTVCLIGESGCGKSVVAKSILQLLPSPPAIITQGHIYFNQQDILALPAKELQQIRGNHIGMVFQEPMTSLNPVLTIGTQVSEHICLHKQTSKAEAIKQALLMLEKVGIPNPQQCIKDYPHQLSGGMRQRVMIAIAMACSPQILIADEPTTALDVTLQRQTLDLMQTLVQETSASLLLITHDFAVVSHIADIIAVMYAGKIVEQGTAHDVLTNPLHPYTQGLLASRPSLQSSKNNKERLHTIAGTVPSLDNRPTGCYFHPRCTQALAKCATQSPMLPDNSLTAWMPTPTHCCSCWLYTNTK